MFLCVKVEKKSDTTLSEAESGLMCCMLHQVVKILHLDTYIAIRLSLRGLLTREATSTEKPLLQRESMIFTKRVAGDWTDRDGSDLDAGIVPKECWVSGVENVPTSLADFD